MNKKQERLISAFDARMRAQACSDASAEVSAINRLHDACVDCGMHHAEVDETAWAARRVTKLLLAA